MKRIYLLLIILFLVGIKSFSQLSALPNNLSTIRSSDISDEQITKIVQQMKQSKVTESQAYQLMLQRGMSIVEANMIRQRIKEALSLEDDAPVKNDAKKESPQDRSNNRMPEIKNDTFTVSNPKKIFGLEIFNNGILSFEPDLKIATPSNYIIGPDDEIVINIYGYQEAKYNLTVSTEGDITIPYVGSIYVSGLTMEQAAAKIKSKLASAGYSNIKTGLTKVNTSLGRIRSIKVTILGEVNKPGSYTLPSLATVFNALYLSGGPNEIGSMRNIQINRNGKIIDTLDMYDFLIKGNQTGNILLRDQDVIRIPPYSSRVSVEGEVKRTGLFEVAKGETLQDVLNFAGGFTDSAYTASVKAYRVTDTEKKIYDIESPKFSTYYPSRSESIVVGKVIDRFDNRVTISGAVYLPGEYELTNGMTVGNLLRKAQGLKEEAYLSRGLIKRLRNDLTEEIVAFSPSEIMNGSSSDIPLKKNDEVMISSVKEFKENYTLRIQGEIRRPGDYSYQEGMTLKDIIFLAGGFTDAATPQRIEIGRRIKKDRYDSSDVQIAQVLNITSINSLNYNENDVKLNPWDVVMVRRNPGYTPQMNVRIEGEVAYPGNYILQNKNERVSDLLKRAGGLTAQAYANGVYLTRKNTKSVISQLNTQKVSKIQEQFRDTTGRVEEEIARPFDQIAIDLTRVLQNPGSVNDITLEEGDVLTIPQEKSGVRISGEVLFPTQVVYQNNMDLLDYIGRAGGLTDNAIKKKIYVLYPNGNASKTRNFLFFKSYPKITPGSEIIVPKQPDNTAKKLSPAELIGITTAITSLAGVLVALIINMNK
jgi:protein involved in polysaccharide export with SLBB domain